MEDIFFGTFQQYKVEPKPTPPLLNNRPIAAYFKQKDIAPRYEYFWEVPKYFYQGSMKRLDQNHYSDEIFLQTNSALYKNPSPEGTCVCIYSGDDTVPLIINEYRFPRLVSTHVRYEVLELFDNMICEINSILSYIYNVFPGNNNQYLMRACEIPIDVENKWQVSSAKIEDLYLASNYWFIVVDSPTSTNYYLDLTRENLYFIFYFEKERGQDIITHYKPPAHIIKHWFNAADYYFQSYINVYAIIDMQGKISLVVRNQNDEMPSPYQTIIENYFFEFSAAEAHIMGNKEGDYTERQYVHTFYVPQTKTYFERNSLFCSKTTNEGTIYLKEIVTYKQETLPAPPQGLAVLNAYVSQWSDGKVNSLEAGNQFFAIGFEGDSTGFSVINNVAPYQTMEIKNPQDYKTYSNMQVFYGESFDYIKLKYDNTLPQQIRGEGQLVLATWVSNNPYWRFLKVPLKELVVSRKL